MPFPAHISCCGDGSFQRSLGKKNQSVKGFFVMLLCVSPTLSEWTLQNSAPSMFWDALHVFTFFTFFPFSIQFPFQPRDQQPHSLLCVHSDAWAYPCPWISNVFVSKPGPNISKCLWELTKLGLQRILTRHPLENVREVGARKRISCILSHKNCALLEMANHSKQMRWKIPKMFQLRS